MWSEVTATSCLEIIAFRFIGVFYECHLNTTGHHLKMTGRLIICCLKMTSNRVFVHTFYSIHTFQSWLYISSVDDFMIYYVEQRLLQHTYKK